MYPCRVKVSWNSLSHNELPRLFPGWTLVHWTNFGHHALAASAATCCVHVAWILIDVAKKYDCCPTQQQTRPIEILWISVAQAGLTHQQYGNLSGPEGAGPGIHQGQV